MIDQQLSSPTLSNKISAITKNQCIVSNSILHTKFSTPKEPVMTRLHFDQDIQPWSNFRASAALFIRQINEARRPLVITQRGKGVAVVIGVSEYEAMREKIELFEDMQKAKVQLSAGLDFSNS